MNEDDRPVMEATPKGPAPCPWCGHAAEFASVTEVIRVAGSNLVEEDVAMPRFRCGRKRCPFHLQYFRARVWMTLAAMKSPASALMGVPERVVGATVTHATLSNKMEDDMAALLTFPTGHDEVDALLNEAEKVIRGVDRPTAVGFLVRAIRTLNASMRALKDRRG